MVELQRYRHIVGVLVKHGFEDTAVTLRGKFKLLATSRRLPLKGKEKIAAKSRPQRLRMALQELGPTFVKMGQLLSTRPDLIPEDYVQELEKLQDRVEPEKGDLILKQLEDELGSKIDDLFTSFQREPIAAGSIAQVHKAVTHDGEKIAIKIRRPGIEKIIQTECKILEDMAGLLKSTVFQHETIDPKKMVREFAEAVEKEVDLTNEKRNQQRFINNFSQDKTIHIPAICDEYCSRGILAMEYIEGIKPSNAKIVTQAGLDPKIVAANGANFVLKQIFDLGFFHADPHPGNFFLMPDNVLAPIDFGQVARLTSTDRKLLNHIVLSIVDNEAEPMVKSLEQAEMLDIRTDTNKLSLDIEHTLDTYHNLPLKEIPFGKLISEIFGIMRNNHVRPPAQFTLMLKSLMTIESFAISLDPDFDIIKCLQPYARRLSLEEISVKKTMKKLKKAAQDASELVSKLPDDLNALVTKFRHGKFEMRIHHEHLENLVKTMNKSSNRISFSLIIAALLIASSMLVPLEGTVLGFVRFQTLGVFGYITAAVIGFWLLISIIRGKGL
ncbi:MAG: hypothetical protein ISS77_05825 [Phycisphaerae bacterium]|nr:hypothetical protein [Phycisphaerae bacterium]